jgi:aminomethyltransferase
MRRTALFERHKERNARTIDFGGWEMPVQYTSIIEEAKAVRASAGLFDVSHMGQVEMRGRDARANAQRLFTNDFAPLPVNRTLYTLMCNEQGGTVDDLIVCQLSDEHFFIVVNASRREADFEWMQTHLQGDATVENFGDARGILALQGPQAEAILQPLCEADLSQVSRHEAIETNVAGAACRLTRTGYTGEDGFEIFPAVEDAPHVWDAILSSNVATVLPCGLGARDVCRLEAGLRLYGHELSEDITPLEAALSWTVKFDKDDFIGKAALEQQKAQGLTRRIVGITMQDRAIAREKYPVLRDGQEIGVVTSGTISPRLNRGIALAFVPPHLAAEGTQLSVRVRNEEHPAVVTKLPFVPFGTKR